MDTIPEAVFYWQMAAVVVELGGNDWKNKKCSAFLQTFMVSHALNSTVAEMLNIACECEKYDK